MKLYAKVVNETTKACTVGFGNPEDIFKKEKWISGISMDGLHIYEERFSTVREYYESLGMTELEVEQAEDGGWYLAGYVPEISLSELKRRRENELWSNYKKFQQTYVDAEDLTLAVVCASQGSEKGAAVQMWVMKLWERYYELKDAIAAAQTGEEVSSVDIMAESFGSPPYTVRELNEEAAAALETMSIGENP